MTSIRRYWVFGRARKAGSTSTVQGVLLVMMTVSSGDKWSVNTFILMIIIIIIYFVYKALIQNKDRFSLYVLSLLSVV